MSQSGCCSRRGWRRPSTGTCGSAAPAPDASPIICPTPIERLYLNGGWCYGGFKATPASGWCFAYTIAKDRPHDFNDPFTLDRFHRGAVIDDKGQGATPRLH